MRYDGTLCEVQELGAEEVLLRTCSRSGDARVNRESAQTFEVDGDGSISYAARLVIVDNVAATGDGQVSITGDEILVVRAASVDWGSDSDSGSSPDGSHTGKKNNSASGITDHSCITQSHETLPWGMQYRNLPSAERHASVAYDLSEDVQIRAATNEVTTNACQLGEYEAQETVMAYSDPASVVLQQNIAHHQLRCFASCLAT